MPIPTPLLPLLNYQAGVLATIGRQEDAMTQPAFNRPGVSQPIQRPSPKFEITQRHIPEQPWSDHANYFVALEDDDDETVAASNVNKGYLNEANFGMEDVIPTKASETPSNPLHTTIP